MKNIKSSMNNIKPKGAIKLYIVELDESKAYPEENLWPKDGLYRYLYQPSEQHGDQRKTS